MPELELRHLRAVRTIAEEGSVTRAATRLGLTQPALSAQLRTVERLLGGLLFDRSRNGCVPTNLGRRVLGTARLVLDEMAQLMSTTRETDRRGPLYLGCISILYFAPLVEGLRQLNADVRAEVRQSSPEIVDLLEQGRVHVALFEFFDGMPSRDLAGSVELAPGAHVYDARGCAIVPGFVDPHTHLLYAGDRRHELRQRLAGKTYAEIAAEGGGIVSTVDATREATEHELVESGRSRLAEMLRCGTTTCEVKSGYGLSLEDERKMLRAIAALASSQPTTWRASSCTIVSPDPSGRDECCWRATPPTS